jgi:hypothetical protein
MEETGIYDTITLTGIFQTQIRKVWTGFMCPRIGTSCHLLLNGPLGSINNRECNELVTTGFSRRPCPMKSVNSKSVYYIEVTLNKMASLKFSIKHLYGKCTEYNPEIILGNNKLLFIT